MASSDNGWDEYKRLVMKELSDLSDQIKALDAKVSTLSDGVSRLQGKAAVVGAIAAVAVTVLFKWALPS